MIQSKFWGRILSLLFFVVCFHLAQADSSDDDPTLPPAKSDTKLIEDIQEGMKDTACLKEKTEALEKYNEKLEAVQKLGKTPKPRGLVTAEQELEGLHQAYLDKVKKCGPCHIHPVVEQTRTSPAGYWYSTNGTCFLPIKDATERAEAFDRMTKSLRTVPDYLLFPNIVKVGVANDKETALDEDVIDLPNEFNAFLAIRTPLELIPNIALTTFFYYIHNKIDESKDAEGNRTFSLEFNSQEAPKELTAAFQGTSKMYHVTPGGRKLQLSLMLLKAVGGRWLLTLEEQGISAGYTTFGDFFLKDARIAKNASYVLLRALLEMHRRGTKGVVDP